MFKIQNPKFNSFNKPAGRFNKSRTWRGTIQQFQRNSFALLSVLIVGAILVAVITVGAGLVIINSQIDISCRQGAAVEAAARSGMDNALLRFSRDPRNYRGEILTLNGVNLTINIIDGSNPYTVRSQATSSGYVVVLEREVTFDDDGVMQVGKEVKP